MIGDHKDAKTGKEYKDLLYQIRPAFGGNIIATIVNPDNRPQMATVREGVMRREYAAVPGAGEVKKIDWQKFVKDTRQVGQTGVTVRPKLYIACGISGQIQHTAGMDGSAMIISINTDPEAPINKIADYAITGDVNEIIPKMIKYYKQNSK